MAVATFLESFGQRNSHCIEVEQIGAVIKTKIAN